MNHTTLTTMQMPRSASKLPTTPQATKDLGRMTQKFILFACFLIFESYNYINCAQQEEEKDYNIRDLMHKAIVIDRDPAKVEQYLQEGFALAQYHSNRDRLHEGRERRINTEKWLQQYFIYPQQNGSSKNLMQLFLSHERTYTMQEKREDFFRIGQAILYYGIDVNTQNATGNSIVHCVAKLPYHQDQLHFLKQLIIAGADMNLQNQHGDTPMHLALQTNQSFELVIPMLCAQADLNIVNAVGKTPLDYASTAVKHDIIVYPLVIKKIYVSPR